jgi:hypothetical protein
LTKANSFNIILKNESNEEKSSLTGNLQRVPNAEME